MLTAVKNILKKLRLFNQLKYSAFGNLYYNWFNRPQYKAAIKELAFYQSFLPSCKLIFDVGANDGHKTVVFKRLANKVVACDPDPYNIEILHILFGKSKSVTIEPFAITDYIGECSFYVQQPGSPLNSINPQWKIILEEHNNNRWAEPITFSKITLNAKTTTLDALIAKHGRPDFIKIDVEGNEQNVLKGLSHPVNYISFEVLLPEFLNEAINCLNLLLSIHKNYRFNYSVDETIILQEFLDYENFTTLLKTLTIPHLEIIATTK